MINNVSFTASLVDKQVIKKYCGWKYQDRPVSFVELDLNDARDCKAAKKISDDWDDSFALFIFDSMEEGKKPKSNHLYALTDQNKNFSTLDADKILGIAVVKEGDKANELDLLQTNPQILDKHDYKYVGSAIINSIKSLFVSKPLNVFSDAGAVHFYEKQGFTQLPSNDSHHYVWKA